MSRPQTRAQLIASIPDDQLACRAGRHQWPGDKLRTGRPLPRGLRAVPVPEVPGVYQMVDTCTGCGKIRRMDTLPRGVYDVSAEYDYKDPPGWVKLPAEEEITKRDLRAENYARCAEALFG